MQIVLLSGRVFCLLTVDLAHFGALAKTFGPHPLQNRRLTEVWDLVDIFYYIVARFDPAVIVAAANSSAEKSSPGSHGWTGCRSRVHRKGGTSRIQI